MANLDIFFSQTLKGHGSAVICPNKSPGRDNAMDGQDRGQNLNTQPNKLICSLSIQKLAEKWHFANLRQLSAENYPNTCDDRACHTKWSDAITATDSWESKTETLPTVG